MLRTIQIITLIQGIFLIFILFRRKGDYKNVNFWLLLGCIVSIMLYALGDDDFNLIVANANWYVFHVPLVVTLFFLLIRYHNSDNDFFRKKDYLYFIPYVLYVIIQSIEASVDNSLNYFIKIAEAPIIFVIFFYMGYIIYDSIKHKKGTWMLYFIIPYAIVNMLEAFSFVMDKQDVFSYMESYGVIGLSTLLLYFILFKLITAPKSVLPKANTKAYKASNLNKNKIEEYKAELITLMEKEKLFMDSNITVNQVAQKMGVPRQYLSEVLNVYLKSNFQDYVNKYRAKEFVECLKNDKFKSYTIMGIASEVGFKSKSSFNTTFKKLYGVTPSEFKKGLL